MIGPLTNNVRAMLLLGILRYLLLQTGNLLLGLLAKGLLGFQFGVLLPFASFCLGLLLLLHRRHKVVTRVSRTNCARKLY